MLLPLWNINSNSKSCEVSNEAVSLTLGPVGPRGPCGPLTPIAPCGKTNTDEVCQKQHKENKCSGLYITAEYQRFLSARKITVGVLVLKNRFRKHNFFFFFISFDISLVIGVSQNKTLFWISGETHSLLRKHPWQAADSFWMLFPKQNYFRLLSFKLLF